MFSRQSVNDKPRKGGEKKESPQAVPGTTKIESLLHALLLQFDLLIKGTKQYLRTPSKMGDVESKESCFERDEKIKVPKEWSK